MTSVVIIGGAGSRSLVRTADSAARQTSRVEIALALPGAGPPAGITASIVKRLGAAVTRAETWPAALNAAVESARGDYVVLVPSPWRLERLLVERCACILDETPDSVAAVPALRLQSTDGQTLQIITAGTSLPHILANPHATPPVIVIRRNAWQSLGGFDNAAGSFAGCEWWLRLLAANRQVALVHEPLATLSASERDWWPPVADGPLDLSLYRAILEQHRTLLERDMAALIVEREMAFGRFVAEHREQVQRRDKSLAELERVRAETAHHHAYLGHHGQSTIEWGDLRRPDPISRDWGYDRGTPIDRRYIEEFLAAHSSDISGAVLEVQEDDFTRRFGGPGIVRGAVVDLDDSNPGATIVTDLRAASDIADAQFDCIILTQTLHVIDDMPAVLRECHRALKPGGVLLATVPSVSRVCLEYGDEGDLWRLTPAGARALFEPIFGPGNVDLTTYGSVLTSVAFLHGLACSELTDGEFDERDPYHPVLVGVRACKAAHSTLTSAGGRHSGVVLLYHRVDEQPDVHDLSVPAALLEQQLGWIANAFRVMPLDQLLNDARNGLPEPAVAITFDDGYLDTLELAAPLLERMGLPATVFATSRWLEERGEYWWDVLERAMLAGDTPPRLTIDLQGTLLTRPTETIEERRAAHDLLHSRLVHAVLEERDRVISHIVGWSGRAPDPERRPMTADELRCLARVPGILVGAHGVNHLALPDQSPAIQRCELLDSVRSLERVLEHRVDIFAFPYGAIDSASADLARATCRWSASCQAASVGRWFDRARVPRLEVKGWDTIVLSRQIGRLFTGAIA